MVEELDEKREELDILFKYRRWKFITDETINYIINLINRTIDRYYEDCFNDCVTADGFFVLKLKDIYLFKEDYSVEFDIVVGDDILIKKIPVHNKVNFYKLYYKLRNEFDNVKVKLYL